LGPNDEKAAGKAFDLRLEDLGLAELEPNDDKAAGNAFWSSFFLTALSIAFIAAAISLDSA